MGPARIRTRWPCTRRNCGEEPLTLWEARVCATRFRLWQRRFHPFNVYTEEKPREKLDYMHNNPLKRGLVSSPGGWPWSSWRFYFLQDASLLRMDRLG